MRKRNPGDIEIRSLERSLKSGDLSAALPLVRILGQRGDYEGFSEIHGYLIDLESDFDLDEADYNYVYSLVQKVNDLGYGYFGRDYGS